MQQQIRFTVPAASIQEGTSAAKSARAADVANLAVS